MSSPQKYSRQPASRLLASVTSARLARTSSRSEGSKLREPAMMIIPGRVAASSGGGERTEIVPYERAALEDRQQPGLVLQEGDVGQGITVDDEQVGQETVPH